MSISLPDARQLSDEVLETLRLRAIRGCELGYTQAEVADLLGLAAIDPRAQAAPGSRDPRAAVDPPGGPRPDPPGVRDRHAGVDGGGVPQAVGLHPRGAAPPRPRPGPRGGPPLDRRGGSGDRAAGGPRGGRDPLARRGR